MLFMKPYRELDHTADIRLEIRACTWPGLLKNAARAVSDTLTSSKSIRAQERRVITIEAPSQEDLLLSVMKQIHLLFEMKDFLTKSLKILDCGPTALRAVARGERFDANRHTIKTEIKAITYHQLEVIHTWCGWRARVILDI